MAKNDKQTKAEKFYESLVGKPTRPLLKKEVETLLSHPLIAEYVTDSSASGGSHLYLVKVNPIFKEYWSSVAISIAVHNGMVSKSYVDDIKKYIGYLILLDEAEKERKNGTT